MAKKFCSDATESLKSAFLKWVSEICPKRLSILISGKTGVGKSRLVNALVGKPVAKEGRSKSPCTDTVNSHSIQISDIEVGVVVWDSPGLQDGTWNESLYLRDMQSKLSRGFDVMIYCINNMSFRIALYFQKSYFNFLRIKFSVKCYLKKSLAFSFRKM